METKPAVRGILVGAGRLGSLVAARAANECSELVVVDHDRVEGRNLESQPYRPEDVGRFKAQVTATRLNALRTGCRTVGLPVPIEQVGYHVLERASLIWVAVDSEASRVHASRSALRAGVPIVADVGISEAGGRVTHLGRDPVSAPLFSGVSSVGEVGFCYGCSIDSAVLHQLHLDDAARPACSVPVGEEPADATQGTGSVADTVCDLLMRTTVGRLLDAAKGLPDAELGNEYRISPKGDVARFTLRPRASCHPAALTARLGKVPVHWAPVTRGQISLRGIREIARELIGDREAFLELDYDIVTEARCARCDSGRAASVAQPGLRHVACGSCGDRRWMVIDVAPRGQGEGEFMDLALEALRTPVDHPILVSTTRSPWALNVRILGDRLFETGVEGPEER